MGKETKIVPIIEQISKQDKLIEVFQKHFPQALQKTEKGFIVDKGQLQRALSPKNCDVTDEGLELRWVGKKDAYYYAYNMTDKILHPLKKESRDFENTGNVLIKGDNLDALKLLQKNYFGKIKMIYIDPPYNTASNGFIYRDNFTKTQEEVLDELGYDKEYKEYVKNIASAETHSGWLSFMYPRLLLARDLLQDDGVIFISIDDNEQANLKLLCDEVFGEENFVANIVRITKSGGNKGDLYKPKKDYVLFYAKKVDSIDKASYGKLLHLHYKWQTEIFNGKERRFCKGDTPYREKLEVRPNQRYYIQAPDGSLMIPKGNVFPFLKGDAEQVKPQSEEDNCWTWSRKRYLVEKKNESLFFVKSKNSPFLDENGEQSKWSIFKKIFEEDVENKREILSDFIPKCENSLGTAELDELKIKGFIYPKSTKLINWIIERTCLDASIILDFFAGSGTTGDAVMRLNAEDGGNRKFILVQLAEPIDKKKNKEAYDFIKNNLKKEPTIFEITAERLRRAGDKIKQEQKKKPSELFSSSPQTVNSLDTGFRIFELVSDESNEIHTIQKNEQSALPGALPGAAVKTERLLYNMLLGAGLSLSEKVECLVKDKCYQVNDHLFILKEFEINEKTAELLEFRKPEYAHIYNRNITDDNFTYNLAKFIKKEKIKIKEPI